MAVTGRGARFNAWTMGKKFPSTDLPRKRLLMGDKDTTEGVMFADWFFAAPPVPPVVGGAHLRMSMGMGL